MGFILADMGLARVLLVVAAVAALAYLLHRGLLAMERRGWIYYRTKGAGSMGASAMFSLDEVFHPEGRHVVVEKQEQQLRGSRRQAPGDLPRPGDESDVSDA
jgi:hypothetical protein